MREREADSRGQSDVLSGYKLRLREIWRDAEAETPAKEIQKEQPVQSVESTQLLQRLLPHAEQRSGARRVELHQLQTLCKPAGLEDRQVWHP